MSDFETPVQILQNLSHNMRCNDNVMNTCNDSNVSLICYDRNKRIEKSEWWYLVEVLEKWHVYSPRAIISKYGAMNCWQAMLKTKENRPRNAGAYFTKVVRNMVTV